MYRLLLTLHVSAGALSLLTGLLAIIFRKGSLLHIRSGRVYYFGMLFTGVSALLLSILKPNPFLTSIGIFSLYLTINARKALDYYRLKEDYRHTWSDRWMAYTGFFTSLFMIGYPLYFSLFYGKHFYQILAIFGCIMGINSVQQIYFYRKNTIINKGEKKWLLAHLGLMGGSYISAVTAFAVNNIQLQPPWVIWLAPSVAGGIFFRMLFNKWKQKLRV